MIPSARERLTRVADSLPFAVRRAAVTVMATLLCLTPCLRSFAVTPAAGAIVYWWLDSNPIRSDIYVKSPGEADAVLIYDAPGFVWHASWSPDGERIVFDHDAILVIDADASNLRRLTDLNLNQFGTHTWGPGPTEVTFYAPIARDDGATWVVAVDVDRPDKRRRILRDGQVSSVPSWAPDGTRLAYSWRPAGAGGRSPLYILNEDSGVATRLTETSAYDPAWSPDGTQVVFVRGNGGAGVDLYIIDARDGAAPRRLTNAAYDKRTPVWLAGGGSPTLRPAMYT